MKKITAFVLLIVMLFSLCGCGNSSKNDADFLKNMTAGLQARWRIANKGKIFTDAAKYREYIAALVDKEIDKIGDLSRYTFEDENLKALAERYIDALNMQKEGNRYYGIDNAEYQRLYEDCGNNERAKVIYSLVNDYGLRVSKKYESTLDEFVIKAEIQLKEEEEAARRVIEISISDKYLNRTYSYKTSTTKKTCYVESFEYSVDYWNNDDTATVTLNIEGEKKSDSKTASSPCYVSWKLRDEQGAVIDSGKFTTGDIAIGEKFKNCNDKIYNLPIGEYTIELLNIVG